MRDYIKQLLEVARKNKLVGVQICNGYDPIGNCEFLYSHEKGDHIKMKIDKIIRQVEREKTRRNRRKVVA